MYTYIYIYIYIYNMYIYVHIKISKFNCDEYRNTKSYNVCGVPHCRVTVRNSAHII